MRTLLNLLLLLALLLFAACSRAVKEQPRQASPPVAQDSPTPQTESSHPNQVTVSIGRMSPEITRLNPHLVEGYSPASIEFSRSASMSQDFPTTLQTQAESPPAGMKWLVVIVELYATQGEVSVPANKIRIVDQSNRTYKLISLGFSNFETFPGRDDRFKLDKLVINSPTGSKLGMLFAVASKAQGLTLEF